MSLFVNPSLDSYYNQIQDTSTIKTNPTKDFVIASDGKGGTYYTTNITSNVFTSTINGLSTMIGMANPPDTMYRVDIYYTATSGNPQSMWPLSSFSITPALPSNWKIASFSNYITLANSTYTTNSCNWLLLPLTYYIHYPVAGTATIAGWNTAQQWGTIVPPRNTITTSNMSTFLFTSLQTASAGIYPLSGGLNVDGDGSNYLCARWFFTLNV